MPSKSPGLFRLPLQISAVALTCSLGLFSPASNASALTIVPSAASVLVGNSFTVDLVISGVVDLAPPSIGSYDIEFGYDDALLGFDTVTFGGPGPDQLDLLNLGPITFLDSSTAGTVLLGEVSLDDTNTLNDFQAGTFTLARLQFTGLAAGTADLSVIAALFADAVGDDLVIDELPGISSVQVVAPIPAAVCKFVSGLGVLPVLRRRTRGSTQAAT